MPEQDVIAPFDAWRKLAVIALIVVVIGLPINHLLGFGLLIGAIVLVLTGTVSSAPRRWGGAALLATLVVIGHAVVPAPRIEEGHNIFIGAGPEADGASGLPDEAYRFMTAQYAAQYPSDTHCDDKAHGCNHLRRSASQRGFAFSADGIFDHPAFSRRVTGINFSDPVSLRLGVTNETLYNWPDSSTELQRFNRNRKFWKVFDRFHLTLPLFVMYQFPADFVGSNLCWRGTVLWETSAEHFASVKHPTTSCQTLQAEDSGRRIFGVSIVRDQPLAMTLKPRPVIRIRRAIESGLTIAGAAGIVLLLVRYSRRRILLPLTLIGGALLVVMLNDALFIGGLRPLDGGDDGLVYDGFGRAILRALLAGDWLGAFRGEEAVYYFTPGLRYFRAGEHLLFGDTFLGYLSVMLALPPLVFATFRRFLPVTWALVFVLLFVLTPLGVLFGSSFTLFVKAASRGYADPLAFTAFLGGLILIVPQADAARPRSLAASFFAALLFAVAVFMRPNLVLIAGAVLAGAAFFAVRERRGGAVAALALGFAPILLSPLHNWIFGQSLVPFSSNVVQSATMRMLPTDYLVAIWELLRLDWSGDHLSRGLHQLAAWLSGPSESFALIPLHAAAIIVLVRVSLVGSRFDPWLRIIAAATLLQHGIGLCYVVYDRYHLLTWLLTCLVALVWLRVEGLPMLEKRLANPRWGRLVRMDRLNLAISRIKEFYGLPESRFRAAV